MEVVRRAQEELAKVWSAVGLVESEREERIKRLEKGLDEFVAAFVKKEEEAKHQMEEDIKVMVDDNKALAKSLGVEIEVPVGCSLREQLGKLETQKESNEKLKAERLDALKSVYNDMGALLRYMPHSELSKFPFPDLEDLQPGSIESSRVVLGELQSLYDTLMDATTSCLTEIEAHALEFGVTTGEELATLIGCATEREGEMKRSDVVDFGSLITSKHFSVFHPCDMQNLTWILGELSGLSQRRRIEATELIEAIARLTTQVSSGADEQDTTDIRAISELVEDSKDKITTSAMEKLAESRDRLVGMRKRRLPLAIAASREELERIWKELMLSPAEVEAKRGLCPNESDMSEETLDTLDILLADARNELERRQTILELIRLRETLHNEQRELEEAAKDPARLTGRARGMGARLIEEAKTRHKIQVQLPKTLKKLLKDVEGWETETGKPWTGDEEEAKRFKDDVRAELDTLVAHPKTKVPNAPSKKGDSRPSSSSSNSRSFERVDKADAVPPQKTVSSASEIPTGRKRPSSSHSRT